jgi:hypothetical protein
MQKTIRGAHEMKKMAGMAAVLAVCMAMLAHSFVVGVPLSEGLQSPEQPLTRLAFGSCSKHDRPQPLWSPISDFQPQLWIWLGNPSSPTYRFIGSYFYFNLFKINK